MTDFPCSAIGLDLGTTSVKVGLLNQCGDLTNVEKRQAPLIKVNGGKYESDALDYARIAEKALGDCIPAAGGCNLLGLSSQRSSFLIWEAETGQPVTPLVSWQDIRGRETCEALRGSESVVRDLCGLPLTPYYLAPKLTAMLRENSALLRALERGKFLVGTLDTFLLWRWTEGAHFVTDASMAARTLLMDMRQGQWSPWLCDLFGIPLSILPKIVCSEGLHLELNNGLVLKASAGDQSAALIASVTDGQPEALVNLGTGCFVARYLPLKMAVPPGYLRTLVYLDATRQAHFAMEGTLNSIAAALEPYPVQGCRPEDLARDEIFCVAEPSGLGAPYFRPDIGVRFSRPVRHLSQRRISVLLLESVIFRVARILEDIHNAYGVERVYMAGGLSTLTCLQEGIARLLPFAVCHLPQSEGSLQGAAMLAAGISSATYRKCDAISVSAANQAIGRKYMGWKAWVDELVTS